jgi:hypothetical protein
LAEKVGEELQLACPELAHWPAANDGPGHCNKGELNSRKLGRSTTSNFKLEEGKYLHPNKQMVNNKCEFSKRRAWG